MLLRWCCEILIDPSSHAGRDKGVSAGLAGTHVDEERVIVFVNRDILRIQVIIGQAKGMKMHYC